MQSTRMNFAVTSLFLGSMVLGGAAIVEAQDTNPVTPPVPENAAVAVPQGGYDNTPLYRIQVVERQIAAINYFHRKGESKIGFEGTSLLPQAGGEATVKALAGRTAIDARFTGLSPANSFGTEYLTYVLWAVTPEGRPVSLGEVLPSGKKGEDQISVTTNLQAFGLMVTAEPYFAVTVPSDLVVVQNVILQNKTYGVLEAVNAHYTLLPRGAYAETAGRRAVLHPVTRNERTLLELYEADNAVDIAEAAGAQKYAADSLATARQALSSAEGYDTNKHDRKETITYAREAVQATEDARLITIRKIKAEDEAAAQQQKIQAEQQAAKARTEQQQAEQQAAKARTEQQQAEQQAEEAKLAAQQQAAQAEQARLQQQQAEQQAHQAQQAKLQAQQEAQRLAEQEQEARERLRQQLNQVLATRETARGLIVNMSDVLFAFNKYELKPEAREKLAKISGILLAYPDLRVQVQGYTDNIGSEEYNQKLSEERADTVKDFLVAQNVAQNNLTAEGLGKNDPVADNGTSSGRAQNRRVELVVSGQSIGIEGGNQPGGNRNEPGGGDPNQQQNQPATGTATPPTQ